MNKTTAPRNPGGHVAMLVGAAKVIASKRALLRHWV